jgi:tetratricopeptide (TPR) repeat protein
MRAWLVVVAGFASLASEARADAVTDSAEKALAAFSAGDEAALRALAEKDDPDPWLVADELCARGEHDAAAAFAKAAPRPDTEKLPAYAAAQKGRSPDTVLRDLVPVANRALQAARFEEALASFDAAKPDGSDIMTVRLLCGRAIALRGLLRFEESAKASLSAAEAAERLGWLARAAAALHDAGQSCYSSSNVRGALEAWERTLRTEEARANRFGVAATLLTIGSAYVNVGAYAEALGYQNRALKLMEELGNRAGTAAALANAGLTLSSLGSCTEALEHQERALGLFDELGDRARKAATLGNMGNTYCRLGAFADALRCHEQSLKLNEEIGERVGMAHALGNIGAIRYSLGEYAEALRWQERALKLREEIGDRAGTAASLANIGLIHYRLGSYADALRYEERALKLEEELGNRAHVASALMHIGLIHRSLGSLAEALRWQEEALKVREELGDRGGTAALLANIGLVHSDLGQHAEALRYQERALKIAEEMGDRAAATIALGNVGRSHLLLGSYAEALKEVERARALAAELGLLDTEVWSLWGLSYGHLRRGDPKEAARWGRDAVAKIGLLVGGLSEELGAAARERWANLWETGVLAGMALSDPAEISFFMESGRAGALLEALGGREALVKTRLPAELLGAEREARDRVATAQAGVAQAHARGEIEKIRAARAALDEAQKALLAVVGRIQGEAKAVADVAYPQATPIEGIQGALRRGETLVCYALLSEKAEALVVTPERARIVDLGKTVDLERTVAALALDDSDGTWEQEAAVARERLLVPLGLGEETRRLLVSPHGVLAYVPFSLLAPRLEVAYVPSGTTYGVLRATAKERGEGVLALGDPDYGVARPPEALTLLRGGAGLVPLPATRAEAMSVGDTVLLGADATEQGLAAALGKRSRWRAVHLACHSIVDCARPALSSLALTPGGDDDGFLTALEVLRMNIPADLVVVSACETAKGRVYKAEGIVGFTRAFMLAGAPRVIVSLWKVDDEATRVVMARFYELWKPGGISTAAALKKAQEHVASQEKWRHPRYWAAWQLWGLPD